MTDHPKLLAEAREAVSDEHMLSFRYAEFTAALRAGAKLATAREAQTIRDAADTIDELVAKVAQLQAPTERQ